MTPQEYIQSKLEDLKKPLGIHKPSNKDQLEEEIFRSLMSKKFRKYSACEALVEHIKKAIQINVEDNLPINITFLHGAYKLWRLEESPEVDWAELFALTYYSNWVKPICELYEPGVCFDFFVDDLIIPKLNNVPPEDIQTYLNSYQQLMNFLKDYQPSNLKMTITPVSSQFESTQDFDNSLQNNIDSLATELPGGLPVLDEAQIAMVELNTKATEEQLKDDHWREKVYLIHNAYMLTKAEPGYHKNRPEKIIAFNQPLPSGTSLSVGSTKDSIMKFWIGVGVLKQKDDSFRQIILSPNQLKGARFEFQDIHISYIKGKNFSKIRVLS